MAQGWHFEQQSTYNCLALSGMCEGTGRLEILCGIKLHVLMLYNYIVATQVLPDCYEVTVGQKILTCHLSNPFFGEGMVTVLLAWTVIVLEDQ